MVINGYGYKIKNGDNIFAISVVLYCNFIVKSLLAVLWHHLIDEAFDGGISRPSEDTDTYEGNPSLCGYGKDDGAYEASDCKEDKQEIEDDFE